MKVNVTFFHKILLAISMFSILLTMKMSSRLVSENHDWFGQSLLVRSMIPTRNLTPMQAQV